MYCCWFPVQNAGCAATALGDKYLVIHDFPSFVEAQKRVDATYADKATWCKLSIQAARLRASWGGVWLQWWLLSDG